MSLHPPFSAPDLPHLSAVDTEMHCHVRAPYTIRAGAYQYVTDEALDTLIAEAEARGRAEAGERIDALEAALSAARLALEFIDGLDVEQVDIEARSVTIWTADMSGTLGIINEVLGLADQPTPDETARMREQVMDTPQHAYMTCSCGNRYVVQFRAVD